MNTALVVALALLAQEPAPPAAPPAVPPAADVSGDYARARAMTAAFADEAAGRRFTLAVANSAVAAGLIGAGIAYVAVSYGDTQLLVKEKEDTQLAGVVIAGMAVVPAVAGIAQLVMRSPDEERLELLSTATTDDERRARLDEVKRSLAAEASASRLGSIAGGAGLIAGGLGAAGLGGYFLALPHLPEQRSIVTHSTGAELIGAGVTSVGVGAALLAAGGSSAALQLQLLDADLDPDLAAPAEPGAASAE